MDNALMVFFYGGKSISNVVALFCYGWWCGERCGPLPLSDMPSWHDASLEGLEAA